jgi:two-component system CheB/CheR fusion protein
MLVLDGKLRVKTASRSFCRTFGVVLAETEGQFIYDLGNGQWNIPALRTLLEEILPKQNSFNDFEVSHVFPGLGQRVMLLNARKMWREENRKELILLAIEDITERKRMADTMLRSNEDFQSFAYSAAHDLRTPLHAALGLSNLLAIRLEGRLDQKEEEMLSLSIKSLERLSELMSDILKYSSLDYTSGQSSRAPIADTLKIALANLQQNIEEHKAEIHVSPLPDFSVERTQVAIIFQNLISNALKYRRDEAPHIHINAEKKAGFWQFSVRDNGQGFEEQYATQIFEPFKRLHGANIIGSGIGLATCKRVIERQGGQLWATSEPGVGSTFFFTIPEL